MKTAQIVLNGSSVSSSLATLTAIQPHLVFVFADPSWCVGEDRLSPLLQALTPAQLVGCSTAGEVAGHGVQENSCVLTAVHFDDPAFTVTRTHVDDMRDSRAAGERLAVALAPHSPHSVLVFGPGVRLNGSSLVAGMAAGLPGATTLAGGLAGDAGHFRTTWTIGPDGIRERDVVAVGFHSPRLKVCHGSFGGWTPFGPVRRVTQAHENILYELDGERALDVYRRYLGDYAKDLPASGLLFPFAMLNGDRDETGIIRTILGIDAEAGSLLLAGEIDPHGYLRLMHASTDRLVDGAAEAAARIGKVPQRSDGLALLVSCVGRKLVMGDRVDEEVEAVARVLGPTSCLAGFYSYGEIAPHGADADCTLHNQTMTITRLHEEA